MPWDPLLPKHCDVPVFDPWDLPPESAPLLWAQEVQRTKRTPFGDEAQQQLQTAHSSCKQQKFSGQERRGKLYQIVIDQGDVENQIPLSCQMLHPLILSRSTPSFGCSVERTQKTFQTSAANEWLRRLSCRRGDMAHSCVLNAVCSNNTSKAAVNHSSCPVQSISAPKCLLDMRIFKIDKSERLYK